MSSHADELAKTINKQVKRIYRENKSIVAEIGSITKVNGLAVSSLSDIIPHGEYMTNRDITLTEGDMVLVVWAGNEPIVTAVIVE